MTKYAHNLTDYGCCEGIAVETPLELNNRPGLSAIAYRIGSYAQFEQSMLARLSGSDGVSALKTRSDGDFSIALLKAAATLLDVLTFYQERTANESCLRTATDRRSVLELARLIGYQLGPGVAASTYLAFTLEEAAGSPEQVTLHEGMRVQSVPGQAEQPQTFETIETIEARPRWNTLRPRLSEPQELTHDLLAIWLEGTNTGLKRGDRLLVIQRKSLLPSLRQIEKIVVDYEAERTLVGTKVLHIWDEEQHSEAGVWAFRLKAAPFGHNAPQQLIDQNEWKEWDLHKKVTGNDQLTEHPNQISLDRETNDVTFGGMVVIERRSKGEAEYIFATVDSVQTRSRSDYGMAGQVTHMKLNTKWIVGEEQLNWPEGDDGNIDLSVLRDMTIYAQSERLGLAEAPKVNPVSGSEISLDNRVDGLAPGRKLIIQGRPAKAPGDPIVSEVITLESTELEDEDKAHTKLTLDAPLRNVYDRGTVTIHANVAAATHGETVQEVLGSGDARRAHQRFRLQQPPLTHVSAATSAGTKSTLRVRVNDLLWHEAPTLYGRGPEERVFVTRTEEDGSTTVQFGDGRTGARLPTSVANVRAEYRKGIGRAGSVKSGQLSLLMTRPVGARDVTNPLPAAGGVDPESLADARRNAPLSVMTLDRVVSLRDYEDFARAFAGIAKARATWTWNGETRKVFITVAGPGGAAIGPDSATRRNLLDALYKAGDPSVLVVVESYRAARFAITEARVRVHSDYETEQIRLAVEERLLSEFSFEARAFGQPVALSEVIAVIQAVPGVVAVEGLRALKRSGEEGPHLSAEMPKAGSRDLVAAAELLTLDPNSLDKLTMAP